MACVRSTPRGALIRLRVVPRASRTGIGEVMGDMLKVRLQAPPVEGKANKALVKLLAKTLGVPARDIEITAGETGRNKQVLVAGATAPQVMDKLEQAITR